MFDFESAKAWHRDFLNYIQSIVNGTVGYGVDLKNVGDETNCELGKWILGQGSDISSLPEFSDLSDKHRRFHDAAALVVSEHLLERATPLTSTNVSDLLPASHAVMQAIDKLQEKLVSW